MREPFVRPFFAKFFYWYAGISTVLGVLICLVYPSFWRRLFGVNLGSVIEVAAGVMAVLTVVQGIATAAVGYVIELIAKIEWNTRPREVGAPAYNPSAVSVVPGAKVYYYIDKGPLVGPLVAPDLLALVRDGKLSISTRYFVEENGQRRALTHLSEINL